MNQAGIEAHPKEDFVGIIPERYKNDPEWVKALNSMKRWNTMIATRPKSSARAQRGLHSHSLNPLFFVSSNAYYFA